MSEVTSFTVASVKIYFWTEQPTQRPQTQKNERRVCDVSFNAWTNHGTQE